MKLSDVTITGGGLAGLCLALGLSSHSFNVTLLERQPKKPAQENNSEKTGEARALALSLSTIEFLRKIGAWEAISKSAEPIERVHVSSKGKFGRTVILASEYNLLALGYVVNADVLMDHLWQRVLLCPSNIEVLRPAEIADLSQAGSLCASANAMDEKFKAYGIKLSDGSFWQTKLLVAADGMDSFARKSLGIQAKAYDHGETAIISNLQLEGSIAPKRTAYERFLEDGSIALLPQSPDHMKSVWIMKSCSSLPWMECQVEYYAAKLQELTFQKLGRFKVRGKRIALPLKSMMAESLYTHRFCLVGNSANTLHPIAAQGFNLACRDVAQLVALLAQAKEANADIGSIDLLQHYGDLRRSDHENTRYFTQKLWERKGSLPLGILAAEFLPPLKSSIAALGVHGKATKMLDLARFQDFLKPAIL